MDTVDVSVFLPHLKKSVLSSLKGAPAVKGCCPYHEETTPSFAIFSNGGFKCFGCGEVGHANELCEKLGIPKIVSNDGSMQRSSANQWLETTYTYRHATGRKHGVVDVFRLADGSKKPLPKMEGAERYGRGAGWPLYRSEELAKNKLDIVWFVEGEKCVEAMRERGFLSTTNQGGSKAYSQADDESLRLLNKRTVVILPDNDDPGEVLAEQVFNDCRRRGCTVSILRLPGLVKDGDDVYDWFKIEGNDADRLKELAEEGVTASRAEATFIRQCRQAADAVEAGTLLNEARKTLMGGLATSVGTRSKDDYTASEAFDEWAERKESGEDDAGWHLGIESIDALAGKMVRRKVIALAGDSGSGKSTYALQMADAVANAGSAVRIYSQEMDAVENVQRIAARLYRKAVKDFTPSDIREISRIYRELPMSIFQRRVTLDFLLADIRMWAALQEDPGMVVVDFIQLIVPGAKEKEDEMIGQIAYALKDLAKELNIVVVLLGQLTVDSRRNQTVRKLTKSDVRNGAQLVDASDQFFILQVDGEPDNDGVRFVNVNLDKFRGGRTGIQGLVFDGPHYEFRDKYASKVVDSRDKRCYSTRTGGVEFVETDF